MTFHPFALAGALVATALTVSAASPAVAATTTLRVPYAGQELAVGGGAKAMDMQLRQAARAVCFAQEPRDLTQRLACTDAAYRDATHQLRLAEAAGAGTTPALR